MEKERKIPGIEFENKKNAELNKSLLNSVLKDFKIIGNITDVRQGPIVTLFELTPAPGTLSSSVIRLSDDIARSMSAKSTRISTIPGKDAIGIEIPNKQRHTVFLKELLDDPLFKKFAKVTQKQAEKTALMFHPGKVVSSEYEVGFDGSITYEFDIQTKLGYEIKVDVDAVTGEIEESNIEIYEIGPEAE